MPTYLSNGDSFKIVADAIREKGKTTELLEFPNGMADAIKNLKVGGSTCGEVILVKEFSMPKYNNVIKVDCPKVILVSSYSEE